MRSRWVAVVLAGWLASGACATRPPAMERPPPEGSVRAVFGGDVMLGRGVASTWRADPASPLAGVRAALVLADVAVANLESPLTTRQHLVGPDALEADPATAAALAGAGFDALSIANNHAVDAGPSTVRETMAALAAVGLPAVGLGPPVLLRRAGLTLALLAFDASGRAPPSIAAWDAEAARTAVEAVRQEADLVFVSIHGGIPYRSRTDPFLRRQARRLATWGVDVVWGHGPHVVQPVRAIDPDGDGRVTVVATSLGNLLFDQGGRGKDRGALLEVRASARGVVAYRVEETRIEGGTVDVVGWRPPRADAVAFDGAWWTPTRPVAPRALPAVDPRLLRRLDPSWDVAQVVRGEADGDVGVEIVVVARVPYRPWPVHDAYERPRDRFVDGQGRVARVAVFDPGLRPRWIPSLIARPVGDVAACAGALVVSYRTLDRPAVTGTGLWVWESFGYAAPVDLPGVGVPGCADVDGDGRPEPVVTRRGTR